VSCYCELEHMPATEESVIVSTGHGPVTRDFIAYGPPSSTVPSAYVLVLHGSLKLSSNELLAPARYMAGAMIGRFDWHNDAAVLFLAGRAVGGGFFCWGAGNDNGLCTAAVDNEDETFVLSVLEWLPWPQAPVYLYGFSGGARMAWRLACNATVASRLSAIAAVSGLLPSAIRGAPSSCDLSAMPPVMVLHGTSDGISHVSEADESTSWLGEYASCERASIPDLRVGETTADLRLWGDCQEASRLSSLAYYRIINGQHKTPAASWLDAIWSFWVSGGAEVPGLSVAQHPGSVAWWVILVAVGGSIVLLAVATMCWNVQMGGSTSGAAPVHITGMPTSTKDHAAAANPAGGGESPDSLEDDASSSSSINCPGV